MHKFKNYVNHELELDTHIETPCKRVGKKLHAFARIINTFPQTKHNYE